MAQADYFLRIDGIQGESTDDKHKGEIGVESWSWGETHADIHAQGPSGGAGRVQMQDFDVEMRASTASPALLLACASGQHFKLATLTCRRAGKDMQEFLRFDFSDVLVSSFQTGATAADVSPMDQVSLNFSKIQVEYKAQRPDGTLGPGVRVGWDQKQNKAF